MRIRPQPHKDSVNSFCDHHLVAACLFGAIESRVSRPQNVFYGTTMQGIEGNAYGQSDPGEQLTVIFDP